MRTRIFCAAKFQNEVKEDAVAANRAAQRYAISDGASSSYAGGAWARIVAREYRRNPYFDLSWVLNARNRFRAAISPPANDRIANLAFERGSFATLLGFTICPDHVEGVAIGDSPLFIQSGAHQEMIPYLTQEQFLSDPVLLSSHADRGALKDSDLALDRARFWLAAPSTGWAGSRFFAMTDKLGIWTISNADVSRQLNRLAEIGSGEEFDEFITGERAAGRMRIDDVTLLVIEA